LRPAFLVIALFCSMPLNQATAANIAIACGAVGVEFELCRQGAQRWAARTGHVVRMISTPNDANERLALFQQLLAARSPDIDVFQIDVVWPGILAPYLLDLTPSMASDGASEHFAVLVANNRVNGRLVAIPWFADAGLLYFRRDLSISVRRRPRGRPNRTRRRGPRGWQGGLERSLAGGQHG
jgi:trehalose/maltose transport system substrate-binding protein